MLKYVSHEIVLEEIPNRVTMAVSISNCKLKCNGCHSPHLRGDIGVELTIEEIEKRFHDLLLSCNCFLFLGEGNDEKSLLYINKYIKKTYNIETALYSGRDSVDDYIYDEFDYVKLGCYNEKFGPLKHKNTNQRLFYKRNDITSQLWK